MPYLAIPDVKGYEYLRTYQLKYDEEEDTPDAFTTFHSPLVVSLPIYRIRKGMFYFFKPYKSFNHVGLDVEALFLQPFYGLGNILRALGTLLILPFISLDTERFTVCPTKKELVASSLLYLLYGAGQIIFWPLTVVQIPFRGIMTLLRGMPLLEDSKGIKKMVSLYPTQNPGTQTLIIRALTNRIRKAATNKQHTNIAIENVEGLLTAYHQAREVTNMQREQQTAHQILSIFKDAIDARKNEKEPGRDRGRALNP